MPGTRTTTGATESRHWTTGTRMPKYHTAPDDPDSAETIWGSTRSGACSPPGVRRTRIYASRFTRPKRTEIRVSSPGSASSGGCGERDLHADGACSRLHRARGKTARVVEYTRSHRSAPSRWAGRASKTRRVIHTARVLACGIVSSEVKPWGRSAGSSGCSRGSSSANAGAQELAPTNSRTLVSGILGSFSESRLGTYSYCAIARVGRGRVWRAVAA